MDLPKGSSVDDSVNELTARTVGEDPQISLTYRCLCQVVSGGRGDDLLSLTSRS